MFDNLLLGLTNVFMPVNFIAISFGALLGLVVGAMPGLSATMAIALLVPVTFAMRPETGISMLSAIYMGAMYGGSIAAVLIRTPGTPSAAATTMDGYPMAQRGEPGRALGISLIASFVGGLISSMVLLTIAPLLGWVALMFGPVELFGVAVLGMTIIASLSQGSLVKGLLSGSLGLLFSTIGMDSITGIPRFTFGNIHLYGGIPFTVALIGLFSIPQAIRLIEREDTGKEAGAENRANKITDRIVRPWSEVKELMPTFVRSAFIGVFTGIIPGTGGDTACWFAYNEAKRRSDDKDSFGKGSPYGIAAPESANNAVVGGALVPTITLGIPGSSSTAVLLGGLMIHGIMPGPTLMTEYAGVTYTLIWSVLLSTIVMFVEGLAFTRACIAVTRVDNRLLSVAVVVLCVIGSFAINNSLFEVGLMLMFGILGYFMDKVDVPVAPMVVGLILGSLLDVTMHQSLLISGGSWLIFLKNPVCAVFLFIALVSLIQTSPWYVRWRARRRFQKANT
ncbi:MAG: tripartite tricarboxylate transporter permease [Synergistaceae bacterium]|jgi:putative tricarboxylic transport membrane protein|nr:tripartite tricarboxylate transporter permease [Synergistaceae bacterium]